ncbi:MAG: hypothetical protein IH597_13365 [Bacteroidales bacterium]|nr:hypothetical protein [Bacteroidales bacterium]
MTAINKNNYEVFFLDHIEGKLNAAQTAELMLFLDAHPQLKEEIEGLEIVPLEPDMHLSFNAKEMLRKPVLAAVGKINEQNYEEYFVADIEGDLTKLENKDVADFLVANPMLQKEYDLFLQCRLQPEPTVVFRNKEALKKSLVIPLLTRQWYYGIAVAASLAILFGLSFLFEPGKTELEEIARVEEVVTAESNPQPQDATTTTEMIDENGLEQATRPSRGSDRKETETKIQKTREFINMNYLASLPGPARIGESRLPKLSSDQRKYFSRYYNDIAMAQNIRYGELLDEEPSAEKLLAQGTSLVKEIFQPGEEQIQILPSQINLWQVADVGINGFARITGADLEFRKKENDEGKVVSFAFESQSMQINRNLRRNR